MGKYLIELLGELGYHVSVRPTAQPEFYSPGNKFQMALAGWNADYPGASSFIVPLHTCGASPPPFLNRGSATRGSMR